MSKLQACRATPRCVPGMQSHSAAKIIRELSRHRCVISTNALFCLLFFESRRHFMKNAYLCIRFGEKLAPSPHQSTSGRVAEWLGRGLQNLVRRFESALDLKKKGRSRTVNGLFLFEGFIFWACPPAPFTCCPGRCHCSRGRGSRRPLLCPPCSCWPGAPLTRVGHTAPTAHAGKTLLSLHNKVSRVAYISSQQKAAFEAGNPGVERQQQQHYAGGNTNAQVNRRNVANGKRVDAA